MNPPRHLSQPKRSTKHVKGPIPATVLWIADEEEILFVVFGVGKMAASGKDGGVLDAEMSAHYREHTKIDLIHRQPIISATFFNCSEYRAFLAVCQWGSPTKPLIKANCLTLALDKALQMCQDCRDNAEEIERHHKVRILDRYAQNILLEPTAQPQRTHGASYLSIPLKKKYGSRPRQD